MKAAVKSIEKFFVEQQVTRLHIPFTGLGHFGSNVLFAQLETDENKQILEKMAEIVRTTFNENKIELPDIRPFNPHLTVAKVKFDKSLKWHKQKKTENVKIKAEYYETLKDTTFGLQQIESKVSYFF